MTGMEKFEQQGLVKIDSLNIDDLRILISSHWEEAGLLRNSIILLENLLFTQKYNRSEKIGIQLHDAIQCIRSQVSFLILCNLVDRNASILHNKDMQLTIDKLIQQAAIKYSDTDQFSKLVRHIKSVRGSDYHTGLPPSRKLLNRYTALMQRIA